MLVPSSNLVYNNLKNALSRKFNISQNNIETCSSVLYNNTRFTIFSDDYKCQNFAITYLNEVSNINFGLIIKYYKLNNVIAIVQKLKK